MAVVTAGVCVACVGDSSVSTTDTADGGIDAGTSVACADMPWPAAGSGNGGPVLGVNTSFNENDVTVTADTFTMFISRGTGTDTAVFQSIRDASSGFPQATRVTDILAITNGTMVPNVSADGLALYVQYRTNGAGGAVPEGGTFFDAAADLTFNLYTYSRASVASAWIGPTPLPGAVNSAANEVQPFISADGNTLFFASDRMTPGVFAIYQATKSGGVFGTVTAITGLAPVGASVGFPVMNAASTKLFYAAPANGTTGEDDIWMVTRANPSGTFGAPVNVDKLSTPAVDRPGYISPDECRFYFTTNRGSVGGDFDVWFSKKK